MLSTPDTHGPLVTVIYPDGNLYIKRGILSLHLSPEETFKLQSDLAARLPELNREADHG